MVDATASVLLKTRTRSMWVTLYTGSFAVLGLVLVLVAFTSPLADWPGLGLFAVMAGVAELTSTELFTSSRSRVSVSSVVAIGSILVFGPLAGVLTHAVSGLMTLATTTLRSKQPEGTRASIIQRSTFNTGMFVTAAAIGGWLYVLTGGTPGQVRVWSNLLPLVGLTIADTFVNIVILIGVIALQTGQRPVHIWTQNFQWSVPITIAGGIVGGGLLGVAYDLFGALGLLAFFLPILSTSYSLRLYVSHTRGYVSQLEEVNRRLDEVNLGLLETLGAIIDADDTYTYGHSAQVAVYAEALAAQLGLSPAEQATIVRAALVHDIGKVGVMDSIIGKQGSLTAEEFAVLKRHPVIGAEIVGRMQGLQDIVPSVRSHHERWDGKGYPDGLIGTAIPLGARIIAVADAVDAMCSDRPYRPLRNFREVVEEVTSCSGQHFDPQLVKAFVAIVDEKGPGFFKNSAASVDRSVLLAGTGTANLTTRYLKRSMLAGPVQPLNTVSG